MTIDWAEISARIEASLPAPDGRAKQAQWQAEDGWIIAYTTGRIAGGPHDGRFAVLAYKPTGTGARTGHAASFERVYLRAFSSRRAAKTRAVAMFRRHSPGWSARHPEADPGEMS